jgi:hypothetical protein
MDELYAFLFVGLFIFLMLFIFFGGVSYTPGYLYNYTENGKDNLTNVSENLKWNIINLGDILISKKDFKKKDTISEEIKIYNGLFFGKYVFKAKHNINETVLNNLKSATLSFSVKDTNNYGDLYVRFNNISLYTGKPIIGKYEFNVTPKKENLIEIETSSSGWKIWAPSTYLISDLSINFGYSLKEYPEYKFLVSNYLFKNLYKGEILFESENIEDKLIIKLNNETVYDKFPYKGINLFSLLNLKEGENKLMFLSEGNIELKNVRIRLYYY